jgi:TolB-like protein
LNFFLVPVGGLALFVCVPLFVGYTSPEEGLVKVDRGAGRDREVIRFGAYQFDVTVQELLKKGSRLKLERQPALVLTTLLRHAGELVTRDHLQTILWPDQTFVDFEQGLNAAVKRLRATLNDSADTPRYIETLSRRGYRFVAPIQRCADIAAVPPSMHGTATESSTGDIRSIAVLPLRNLTGDASQEFFADGMTDALITDLAQIGALRVISRTSVMRFKQTDRSLTEIARELSVDAVIEGSVVRSGSRVRITAQLIHTHSDRHLWARSYDRDLIDVIALQGEIAQAVADEVRVTITPEQRCRMNTPKPVDRDAYELYLRGRFHACQWSPEGVRKAIEYYQRAISRDPGFALGYAALADVYNWSTIIAANSATEYFPLGKEAATRALTLDPGLADAYTALGIVKSFYEFDRVGAERDLLKGIELNPNSAEAHRCYACAHLRCVGRHQDAIAEVQKAVALDPLSVQMHFSLALAYMYAGNVDGALMGFRSALELDPNRPRERMALAVFLAELGHFMDAAAELEKGLTFLGLPPREAAERAAALRGGYEHAGAEGFWRQYLDWALEATGQPDEFWFGFADIAEAYAQLGDKDQAFAWLEKSYSQREGIFLSGLHCDPGFRNLHGEPRFADLIQRLNLRF